MLAVYSMQALSLCVPFSFRRIHVNTPLIPTTDPAVPPFGLHSVCKTLSDSNATLDRFAWLGDQLAVAIWTRETKEAETVYAQPGHHTLSCYLDGGYRTERNALLKFIADNGIKNVVFLATDDHQNRVNELLYSPTGQTEDQSTYVHVPHCLAIVDGPLGATGPDTSIAAGLSGRSWLASCTAVA